MGAGTAALVSGAIAATVVTAHAATAGCRVSYTVGSQWAGGFTASVAVTNLGDPVSGWTLTWTYAAGQAVTQAWNATVTQSGSRVTATNASYNGSVGTNGTVSFGFNGSWNNGGNPVPTDFAVNGTACGGSAPGSPPASSPTPPVTPSGTFLQYNGGSHGTFTQSPVVYLVFYGSQWGSGGGSIQSQAEGFFRGLGTNGETWSRIVTQYCNGVPAGTVTCPGSATHIPYPAGGSVFGGTWVDTSKPAPSAPGDDLITEARSAAVHFGVTGALARSMFVIFSPNGTSAGGGYSWHTTTADGYNVINAAYGWQSTVVLSHEYAETLTDVNAGWTTADHTAEIADLCGPAGNLTLSTGSFPIVSLWSNRANACVVSG
ncbi:MAG TPA: cellulose-binding domain-containing protein [Rugosimonospora sp.]|nr:cellulose-binding domain-containing protein [Rugosimonospora sp.]